MNIALRDVRRLSIDTSHIEIRLMTHDDVPDVVRLFDTYFHESQWPPYLTFDAVKVKNRLHDLVERKSHPHLLAFDNGEVVAVMSWHYDAQYTEPIAVLDEVYALKPYRHTNLGRKLIGLALWMAHRESAPVFNFPIASGLIETKSLVNCLRKFGGEICGVIVRVLPEDAMKRMGGDDGR